MLSLGISSASGGTLAAISLAMRASLGSCTEDTSLAGGEVLLAGGVVLSWLLGLRCSLVLWYISLECPPHRLGGALSAVAC